MGGNAVYLFALILGFSLIANSWETPLSAPQIEEEKNPIDPNSSSINQSTLSNNDNSTNNENKKEESNVSESEDGPEYEESPYYLVELPQYGDEDMFSESRILERHSRSCPYARQMMELLKKRSHRFDERARVPHGQYKHDFRQKRESEDINKDSHNDSVNQQKSEEAPKIVIKRINSPEELSYYLYHHHEAHEPCANIKTDPALYENSHEIVNLNDYIERFKRSADDRRAKRSLESTEKFRNKRSLGGIENHEINSKLDEGLVRPVIEESSSVVRKQTCCGLNLENHEINKRSTDEKKIENKNKESEKIVKRSTDNSKDVSDVVRSENCCAVDGNDEETDKKINKRETDQSDKELKDSTGVVKSKTCCGVDENDESRLKRSTDLGSKDPSGVVKSRTCCGVEEDDESRLKRPIDEEDKKISKRETHNSDEEFAENNGKDPSGVVISKTCCGVDGNDEPRSKRSAENTDKILNKRAAVNSDEEIENNNGKDSSGVVSSKTCCAVDGNDKSRSKRSAENTDKILNKRAVENSNKEFEDDQDPSGVVKSKTCCGIDENNKPRSKRSVENTDRRLKKRAVDKEFEDNNDKKSPGAAKAQTCCGIGENKEESRSKRSAEKVDKLINKRAIDNPDKEFEDSKGKDSTGVAKPQTCCGIGENNEETRSKRSADKTEKQINKRDVDYTDQELLSKLQSAVEKCKSFFTPEVIEMLESGKTLTQKEKTRTKRRVNYLWEDPTYEKLNVYPAWDACVEEMYEVPGFTEPGFDWQILGDHFRHFLAKKKDLHESYQLGLYAAFREMTGMHRWMKQGKITGPYKSGSFTPYYYGQRLKEGKPSFTTYVGQQPYGRQGSYFEHEPYVPQQERRTLNIDISDNADDDHVHISNDGFISS